MRLPLFFYFLGPRDIVGIVLTALLLGVVLFVSVTYPDDFAKHGIGWKFGPGWTCQSVASGEPVCIKDVPKRPSSQER